MDSDDRPPEREPAKADAQFELVKAAFAADGIRVNAETFDDGSIDYAYEEDAILVRDAYLPDVREMVGGESRDGLIDGVTVLSLADSDYSATGALAEIDSRLGAGVASPNHVLSICPAGMCPATEPDVPPPHADPDPGICPDRQGGGVSVYVADTGLLDDAHTHPWLAGVIRVGQADEFTAPDIPPYTGHGTFIAGVERCMAPGSEVRVDNLLHYSGAHLESEIIKHLDRAMRFAPDVISLSAGGTSRGDLPPLGFEALWRRYRHHKGVQLVAAAGNNGERRPFWPAAFPQVVSVGALAANWRSRAAFSNFGGWVDVYAPGEGLVNAYATGVFTCHEPPHTGERRHFHGMARWSGTSFSTPLVAGLIAARVSRTGENSRRAARALLRLAREQAIPGVGPALYPCDTGRQPCMTGCGHRRHEERCDHCHHHRPGCA
jgi:subtilisin family serine protease